MRRFGRFPWYDERFSGDISWPVRRPRPFVDEAWAMENEGSPSVHPTCKRQQMMNSLEFSAPSAQRSNVHIMFIHGLGKASCKVQHESKEDHFQEKEESG